MLRKKCVKKFFMEKTAVKPIFVKMNCFEKIYEKHYFVEKFLKTFSAKICVLKTFLSLKDNLVSPNYTIVFFKMKSCFLIFQTV